MSLGLGAYMRLILVSLNTRADPASEPPIPRLSQREYMRFIKREACPDGNFQALSSSRSLRWSVHVLMTHPARYIDRLHTFILYWLC